MAEAAPRPAGGPPVRVRDLRWEDFEPLCEAYYLLYDERERGEPHGIHLFRDRPGLSDEVRWFESLYRRAIEGEIVVVVGEVGGRAVGNCTVGPVGTTRNSEAGHVGVLGVLVHRDHRGRGVGTALLDAAIARCRGKFELVRLSVFATNVRAKALYERLGFRTVGRVPRAYHRGTEYIDEELMVLDLHDAPARA